MFLHAGAGEVVRTEKIVGIFDLDGKITTADTASFLRRAEKAGAAVMAGWDLPKSFLLLAPARRKKKVRARTETVVFSHLSVSALGGRGSI